MIIKLSNNSNKPIYEQITDQLKQAILAGVLMTGDALPSIRALAKELKISVMTTKRAYADLERDGFIETIAGKGSYVAGRNQDFLREELIRQVEIHLTKAVSVAKLANVKKEELHELLDLLLEDSDENH
ncbi:GntR family transcriptional regulator [Solibacillus sp.]|uniref:GntR family transcriptional regulator n=1 Tax=Solibacillus sp. TaxID=1909654 RepID=UPI003315BC16